MNKNSFNKMLHKLSQQKGEEKLYLAFRLNELVKQVRAAGELYAKKQSAIRSRTTA